MFESFTKQIYVVSQMSLQHISIYRSSQSALHGRVMDILQLDAMYLIYIKKGKLPKDCNVKP